MASVHASRKSGVIDETFPIAIVDFNFSFISKDHASVNECSVYDYNKSTGQTWHILPEPTTDEQFANFQKYDRQLKFARRFFHGIPPYYGCSQFDSFRTCLAVTILNRYSAILVKGRDKEDVLGGILPDDVNRRVFNLDKLACPNLSDLRDTYTSTQQSFCVLHGPHFQGCTALKCSVVERWLTDNYQATKYFITRELDK